MMTISKSGEKYDKKFMTAKDCATLINNFYEKKNEELIMGSYFVKIKELYSILELCENFDLVFDYIVRRFKAIKNIHDQADQYDTLIKNLNSSLEKVETKFKILKDKYGEMSGEMNKYKEVLEKFEEVEDKIKKSILV